ncbi:MAG TPA: MFS transporter [Actinocatenispora sp.]
MPRSVYVLAAGIFAMVTSEFAVAGLMPQLAEGLRVTVPQVGYLITAYAVAMALGGPFVSAALLRLRARTALAVLLAVFLAGNVLAATAPSYPVMVVARVVTGATAQAFFGVAVSLAVRLARPDVRGRAIAVVMNGLMLGTLLGLPLSTMVGERLGWRAAFWAVGALTLAAAAITALAVPNVRYGDTGGLPLRDRLAVFARPRLWRTLSTSTFVIGATFAAFSYLNPVLTRLSGFRSSTVPLLLVAYGAATVLGNTVVGRLADRHAVRVVVAGLALNTLFLAGFAVFARHDALAVTCMLGIGLVGVTMNPAMVTRVQRAGDTGPLVNTVHSSFITGGVVVGSSLGGVAIGMFGLVGTLWLGAVLAAVGLATVLPDVRRRAAAHPAAAVREPAVR